MADAGRDVTEQEAEMVAYGKDAGSRAQSFNTVNKDFSVGAEDVPNMDHDPIMPGRRRMLLLACMCILGKSRSRAQSQNKRRHTKLTSLLSVVQAMSFVRGRSHQAVLLLSLPSQLQLQDNSCDSSETSDLTTRSSHKK